MGVRKHVGDESFCLDRCVIPFKHTFLSAPGLVTNLTAFAQNHSFVVVTWFLPRRINGLITKFAVKAKHARTGQTVRTLEVNAEDIMTVALPHCNVQLHTTALAHVPTALLASFYLAPALHFCPGCSGYFVQSDSQPLGDDSVEPTHHSVRRALCSVLERAHLSGSGSATALYRLPVRGVCLHLGWRGPDSLHHGPHARIRFGRTPPRLGFHLGLPR